MKITFLVNNDLAATHALNLLLPSLQQHAITIFYTDQSKPLKAVATQLIALAKFEQQVLNNGSLTSIASFGGKPLNHINDNQDLAEFQSSRPDLVISIRHMSILQAAVIATPKLGVLNLHSGLLPDYQGVMATFWAMHRGEKSIGTTLHYIEDAGIDTGAIIARSETATRLDKSYLWNMLNVYDKGCLKLLLAVAQLAKTNTLKARAQNSPASYFSYPTDRDLEAFKAPLF